MRFRAIILQILENIHAAGIAHAKASVSSRDLLRDSRESGIGHS